MDVHMWRCIQPRAWFNIAPPFLYSSSVRPYSREKKSDWMHSVTESTINQSIDQMKSNTTVSRHRQRHTAVQQDRETDADRHGIRGVFDSACMQSRVYVTVVRPSVRPCVCPCACLSRRSIAAGRAAGLLLSDPQAGHIDR